MRPRSQTHQNRALARAQFERQKAMKSCLCTLLILAALVGATQDCSAAVLLNTYSENFDSMGTAGTVPPASWTMKTATTGTNATWTNATGIPASGVAGMVNTSGPLTAASPPSGTNNNGFNAGSSAGATDRALATSPTSISGGGIELQLTNGTGGPLNSIDLAYDIRRFTA